MTSEAQKAYLEHIHQIKKIGTGGGTPREKAVALQQEKQRYYRSFTGGGWGGKPSRYGGDSGGPSGSSKAELEAQRKAEEAEKARLELERQKELQLTPFEMILLQKGGRQAEIGKQVYEKRTGEAYTGPPSVVIGGKIIPIKPKDKVKPEPSKIVSAEGKLQPIKKEVQPSKIITIPIGKTGQPPMTFQEAQMIQKGGAFTIIGQQQYERRTGEKYTGPSAKVLPSDKTMIDLVTGQPIPKRKSPETIDVQEFKQRTYDVMKGWGSAVSGYQTALEEIKPEETYKIPGMFLGKAYEKYGEEPITIEGWRVQKIWSEEVIPNIQEKHREASLYWQQAIGYTKEWHPETKIIIKPSGEAEVKFPYEGAWKYGSHKKMLQGEFKQTVPSQIAEGILMSIPIFGASRILSGIGKDQRKAEAQWASALGSAFTPKNIFGIPAAYYTLTGEKKKAQEIQLKGLGYLQTKKEKGLRGFGEYLVESPYVQVGITTAIMVPVGGGITAIGAGLAGKSALLGSAFKVGQIGIAGFFGGMAAGDVAKTYGLRLDKQKGLIGGWYLTPEKERKPGEALGKGAFYGALFYGAYKGGQLGQQYVGRGGLTLPERLFKLGYLSRLRTNIAKGTLEPAKGQAMIEAVQTRAGLLARGRQLGIYGETPIGEPQFGKVQTLRGQMGYQAYLEGKLPTVEHELFGSITRATGGHDIDIFLKSRQASMLKLVGERLTGQPIETIADIKPFQRPGAVVERFYGLKMEPLKTPSGKYTMMDPFEQWMRLSGSAIEPPSTRVRYVPKLGRLEAKDVLKAIELTGEVFPESKYPELQSLTNQLTKALTFLGREPQVMGASEESYLFGGGIRAGAFKLGMKFWEKVTPESMIKGEIATFKPSFKITSMMNLPSSMVTGISIGILPAKPSPVTSVPSVSVTSLFPVSSTPISKSLSQSISSMLSSLAPSPSQYKSSSYPSPSISPSIYPSPPSPSSYIISPSPPSPPSGYYPPSPSPYYPSPPPPSIITPFPPGFRLEGRGAGGFGFGLFGKVKKIRGRETINPFEEWWS